MVVCAIIGCGLMGCKIAGEFALQGHRVRMYDSDPVILNSVFERIKDDKNELLKEGLLMQPVFTGSILCVSRLEDCLRGAELIFEVVPDDWEIKKYVLEEISKLASSTAVIATNTLRLDVDKLSLCISNPERFIGLRFLFPVYFIPEVEVTLATNTPNQVALTFVRNVLESMGKTLFFRSGAEPMILSEEQRKSRWDAAREGLWNDCVSSDYSQRQLSDNQDTHAYSHFNFLSSSFNSNTSNSVWLTSNSIDKCASTSHLPPNLSTIHNTALSSSSVTTECAICMEFERDCLLEPCRHLILCKSCATALLKRNDYCPLCRVRINTVSDVYLS